MDETVTRVVAYVAAGRIRGRFGSSIYSRDEGRHNAMSSSYDYGAGAHYGGAKSGSLYHYGKGCHVQLKERGDRFSGCDYGSGAHFTGTVRGSRVQIYDYGTGRYHDYTV